MGRNDPEGSFFFKSYTDPIRRNGTMAKKRLLYMVLSNLLAMF
jgi:hypothetical protein